MKVSLSSQMKNADKMAWEKFGIPSIVLMENAAISCVNEIKNFHKFVILCGKGNNGGDGFAIARHLINMGKEVKIYLLLGDNFSNDAKINFDILKNMDIPYYADTDNLKTDILLCDCVVDAIFGTGIKGEIAEEILNVIDIVNENSKYILSVDIPSGVCADSGKVLKNAIKANKTITFGAYKRGLLLYPGADYTGKIKVCDISLPKQATEDIRVETIEEELVQSLIPKRRNNSQKGDYGKVLVIGGSVGMAGAVCLAICGAFGVGAGIVTAIVPTEINDIIQKTIPNAMTYPVDFRKDTAKIIDKMQGFDAVLFGNGIGREEFVIDLLESVAKNAKVPVIIDADGLFALSKKSEILKCCKSNIIITPHAMEMARLVGSTVDGIEADRLGISEKYVLENGLTLVLKGNHTIITTQDGKQFINMTGNSGMATAGSGDVLAGMVAGFVGGKISIQDATISAVYLHGLAGDFAAKQTNKLSLSSLDIAKAISHILPVEI